MRPPLSKHLPASLLSREQPEQECKHLQGSEQEHPHSEIKIVTPKGNQQYQRSLEFKDPSLVGIYPAPVKVTQIKHPVIKIQTTHPTIKPLGPTQTKDTIPKSRTTLVKYEE
ncbi:hypothetical protein GWK47_052123 [Chionoecetes opilio]|uniref:Uncharacterized protein n=1 Tax=Chionoecetes opilio TaxID=41210 RepID=A0A8J4Y1V5_CHIOP|nr:hypothetical protein GWK47_052123 [Chionoecetes opilio]